MSEILKDKQQEYLHLLLRPSSGIIAEMETYAAENGIPILDKHSSRFLELLISIKKPVAVLEIGTAIGYSAIRIAGLLEDNAFIDTIEKSKPNVQIAKSFIERSGKGRKINLIEGDALEILKNHKIKYDFIFLDADKEDYKILFDLSIPLLNQDGIILIDNLLWHGYAAEDEVPEKFKRSTELIREFNEYFLSFSGLLTQIIPVGDGLGLGIKENSGP